VGTHTIEWTSGERVRKIRRLMGMKQPEFAALIGIGDRKLAAWESGATQQPRDLLELARRIEEVTPFSAADVPGITPPEHPQGPGGRMGSTGDKRRYFSPKRVRNTRIRPIGRHGIVTQNVATFNAA